MLTNNVLSIFIIHKRNPASLAIIPQVPPSCLALAPTDLLQSVDLPTGQFVRVESCNRWSLSMSVMSSQFSRAVPFLLPNHTHLCTWVLFCLPILQWMGTWAVSTFFALTNNTVVNICVQDFVCFMSLACVCRHGIAGSYGSSVCNRLRSYWTVLQSGPTVPHPHRCVQAPSFSAASATLVTVHFLITDVLVNGK